MGGQPWPELELHGRPWGAHRRGGRGGTRRGRGGGAQLGCSWGAMGRAAMEGATRSSLVRSSARAALRVFCFCVLCAGRRKEKRREEKRRERRREGKKWKKNGTNLYTWKLLEKNNR
jgi:hypothetical protein